MTADSQRHVLKLNCSTCGATGITVWADHVPVCPGPNLATRQPLPGLCAVCAHRAAESGNKFHVKEPHGGPHEAGWRTVDGTELHEILFKWSRAGSEFYLEGALVTNPVMPDGEEHLPMLPVTVVDGMGVCAAHVGSLFSGRRGR